MEKQQMSIL